MKKNKNITMMQFSIVFSFIYVLIYCLGLGGVFDFEYTFLLYLCSPAIILWVVYSILNDKNVPSKTFTDYFYQDSEIKRTKKVR